MHLIERVATFYNVSISIGSMVMHGTPIGFIIKNCSMINIFLVMVATGGRGLMFLWYSFAKDERSWHEYLLP